MAENAFVLGVSALAGGPALAGGDIPTGGVSAAFGISAQSSFAPAGFVTVFAAFGITAQSSFAPTPSTDTSAAFGITAQSSFAPVGFQTQFGTFGITAQSSFSPGPVPGPPVPVDLVASLPYWVWEVDVTNDPASVTTTWQDITPYVRGATITRGKQAETGRDQAGTIQVDLYNGDRRFDFFNTAGPYGSGFRPMRRIRCRAIWSTITYPMFFGFIDYPELGYQGYADAITTISATDGFKVLNNKLISGDFPAQRSDQRIAALLTAGGWPLGMRSLAVGVSMLDPITLDKVSVLGHIQQVADSESGRLFIDASGRVVFIDRHAPYLSTSQATFGESEINYVDVGFKGDDSLLANEILVQRAADLAEERSAVDVASQAAYMPRSVSFTGMLFDHDNEASDKASFELSLRKDYKARIVSMLLDGTYQPSTLWPQALGRELGDRLTVRKRPPGGGTIEQESFLERIEHRVGVGTWETNFGLSAIGIGYQIYPSGHAIFTLGDPINGKIGAGQVGVLAY